MAHSRGILKAQAIPGPYEPHEHGDISNFHLITSGRGNKTISYVDEDPLHQAFGVLIQREMRPTKPRGGGICQLLPGFCKNASP